PVERRRRSARDRPRRGPGGDGEPNGRAEARRRRGRRGSGPRPREDRRRRAAPRHRPDRPWARPWQRPEARRARVVGRSRRPQHRRRRRRRRGHGTGRRAARGDRRRDRRRRRRHRHGRAAARRRRAARGHAARGGDRAEPRVQRRGGRARLVGRDAVPDARVPRALGDPEPEADRQGSRRRRPLRARAAGSRMILSNAWIVTMDDAGTEQESGWLRIEDGRIAEIGGSVPPERGDDLGGAVVTPGLVNTHHHLYQTLTRGRAADKILFEWLKELYPVWAGIDAEMEHAAARTGLAELALSGCSTVFDHHYVFPRGVPELVEAEVAAARELGVRIVASRGSMDLGESDGGLPPDSLVEDVDAV